MTQPQFLCYKIDRIVDLIDDSRLEEAKELLDELRLDAAELRKWGQLGHNEKERYKFIYEQYKENA